MRGKLWVLCLLGLVDVINGEVKANGLDGFWLACGEKFRIEGLDLIYFSWIFLVTKWKIRIY